MKIYKACLTFPVDGIPLCTLCVCVSKAFRREDRGLDVVTVAMCICMFGGLLVAVSKGLRTTVVVVVVESD